MTGVTRDTLRKVPKAIRNPHLIRRQVRRKGLRINSLLYDHFWNDDPVFVMEEDWDNLIILDGCRYDVFTEVNTINGRTESRISAGSSTGDFLESNFNGSTHYDTVYLTANPHHFIVEGTFHTVIDLVHNDEYWDEQYKTVLPGTVVDKAEEMVSEFPNKRYLIHLMQPHFPLIGEKGRSLDFDGTNVGHRRDSHPDARTPWEELPFKSKEVHDEVREAYRENLRLVLEHVQELLDLLSGRSVISADHGNLLGERSFPIPVRGYGHPSPAYVPGLVKVPWHVVESDERREVWPDEPIEYEVPNRDVVTERLAQLGYIN